jgi:high-affinity iron transporter
MNPNNGTMTTRIMPDLTKISLPYLLVLFVSMWVSGFVHAQDLDQKSGAKQLWQLIDYVAVDYGGAVEHSAVVSDSEYAEMLDFTENAIQQVAALPAHPSKANLAAAVADLRAAVVQKADAAEVKRLAHRSNELLIAAYPIPVAPKALPNLVHGSSLYSTQCASCHGVSGHGDGPLAANLEPKPIAFSDSERAQSRSLMALGTWPFLSAVCRMTMRRAHVARKCGAKTPNSEVYFPISPR